MTLRVALVALLTLHGLLHFIGVRAWLRPASGSHAILTTTFRLPPEVASWIGPCWLLAAVVLLAAAAARAFDVSWWWALAIAGAVFSQGLIVLAWSSAKYGSVVNVIALVAAIFAVARSHRVDSIADEARALLRSEAGIEASVVHADELGSLPAPVERWLVASGIVGRDRARTVRLRQRGALRASARSPWMTADAEQYFTVDDPGFVWTVEASLFGASFLGRDRYHDGGGAMRIDFASMLPVVDARDDKIAVGALQRFLAEIVWFPSAALSPYIRWAAMDDRHARATIDDAGLSVSVDFAIDERGRVSGLEAQRYLGGGADGRLEPWFVRCHAWRTMDGVTVPVRGEVGWQLTEGELVYYRWEIVALETNVARVYADDEGPSRSRVSR